MNIQVAFILWGLFALSAQAQQPSSPAGRTVNDLNTTSQAVLMANRPSAFTPEQWLLWMEDPVNRSFYPLRITQSLLDTVDPRELDLRFRYIMTSDDKAKVEHTAPVYPTRLAIPDNPLPSAD